MDYASILQSLFFNISSENFDCDEKFLDEFLTFINFLLENSEGNSLEELRNAVEKKHKKEIENFFNNLEENKKLKMYNLLDILKDYLKEEDEFVVSNRSIFKLSIGRLAFEKMKRHEKIFSNNLVYKFLTKEELKYLYDKAELITILRNADDKNIDEKIKSLKSYEFVQDYFAAYYVSTLKQENLKDIIRRYKFFHNMQAFFIFLADMLDNKNFLISEILNSPKDELGVYETNLLVNLLTQINYDDLEENIISDIRDGIDLLFRHFLDEHKFGSAFKVIFSGKILDYENIENYLDALFFIYLYFDEIDKIKRHKPLFTKFRENIVSFISTYWDICEHKVCYFCIGLYEITKDLNILDDNLIKKLESAIEFEDEALDNRICAGILLFALGKREKWIAEILLELQQRICGSTNSCWLTDGLEYSYPLDVILGIVTENNKHDIGFAKKVMDMYFDCFNEDLCSLIKDIVGNMKGNYKALYEYMEIYTTDEIYFSPFCGLMGMFTKGLQDIENIMKIFTSIKNIESFLKKKKNLITNEDTEIFVYLFYVYSINILFELTEKNGGINDIALEGIKNNILPKVLENLREYTKNSSFLKNNYEKKYKLTKILTDIFNKKNISTSCKVSLVGILANLGIKDSWLFDKLIELAKDRKNLDLRLSRAIAEAYITMNTDENDFLNRISKILEDEDIKDLVKVEIVKILADNGINNEELVDMIKKIRRSTYTYITGKMKMVNILISKNVNTDEIINLLIEIMEYKLPPEERKLLKTLTKEEFFGKCKNFFPYNYDFNDFLTECRTELILNAYRKNLINLEYLLSYGMNAIYPFYLKGNFLYTVFHGQEINLGKVSIKEFRKIIEEIKSKIPDLDSF